MLNAANKESKKADKYFAAGDYKNAIEMYEAAMDTESDPVEKALYKYQIGVANYRLDNVSKAEKNLSDAIKQGYMSAEAYLILGDVKLKLGKTDDALSAYESYRLANPDDNSIVVKIASVKFAKENQQNLSLFKLDILKIVNSNKNEFGISYFNESLMFSSTKSISSASDDEESEGRTNEYGDKVIPDKKQKKQSYTKEGLSQTYIWLATAGGAGYNRPIQISELNKRKDFADDGVMIYDPYSKQAYYTKIEGKKAFIYTLQIVNNQWKKNEKIEVQSQGEPIGHPFITPDGERIYFTSTMPGGKGKSDIWYITKMGSEWSSVPVNAGDNINTPGNEVYPHISDGYFFFASDGRIGMGGLDIYVSKVTSSGFERPINLGTPFNSTADDYNLIIRLDHAEGLLVSSRNQRTGADIYRFEGFPSNLTITGKVKDSNSGASISNVALELFIENKSLNKIVSDANGDFVIPVRPNINYRLVASVAGYSPSEKSFTSPADLFARLSKESGIDLDFSLQANAAVISGKVYDIQTLMPLEGVTVTLVANGKGVQTTNVDPSGIYKFSNLTSNTDYIVRLDPKGYFWDNKNVHVTNSSQQFEYNKNSGHDMDFALQKYDINKEIIMSTVQFQEDRANILTESYKELDLIANMFIQNPHCIILLKGHVDVAIKSEVANKLSQLRVNEIRDYLLSKKVNPAQILQPSAMGRQTPLFRNPISEEERRMNNRITYTVSRIDVAKELEYSHANVTQTNKAQTSTGTSTGVKPSQTTTTTTKPPAQTTTTTTQQPQQQQVTQPANNANSDDLPYIVQIGVGGSLDLKNPDYAKVTTQLGLQVKAKLVDGKYKYYVGGFNTKTEADDMKDKLVKIGFKDAWSRSKY
jgi:outer membrane protein OmpA-like peptidoglycan-associated protein/tetratricopeptide (TPR) repeat protein